MLSNILPGIYKLEIPLPQNPLKAVNSYIIKDSKRSLIIDTGMNRPECIEVLNQGIKELNLDMNKTDIFITHLHADHCGLMSYLATPESRIYCSHQDALEINELLEDEQKSYWQQVADFAFVNGFADARNAVKHHPGAKYSVGDDVAHIDFVLLKHGDIISVGDYNLACIATPGHTDGHMCLYEKDKKILFSGDHILGGITPNITLFADDSNPLQQYLSSLELVYGLDVEVILTAHRAAPDNHRVRIDELKAHHARRCQEILDILGRRPDARATAYEIAPHMTWDLKYDHWDQFPPAQKWFATGETIAHLQYLYEKRKLVRHMDKDIIKYSLA